MLREADKLAEKLNEAKLLPKELHGIYDRLKTSLEDRPWPEEGANLARNAETPLNRLIKKFYKIDNVRRFVAKIRNNIDHWFTFVTTPGIESKNNLAERTLKAHAVK